MFEEKGQCGENTGNNYKNNHPMSCNYQDVSFKKETHVK